MSGEKVRRIFVEKKPGFNVEARYLGRELNDFLGIKGLDKVRIINRYDIEGISEEEYRRSREIIFAEPPVDEVYDEEFPLPDDCRVLAVEYQPGQYDQRADSAAQCVQILTRNEKPDIRCARIYIFEGEISDSDYEMIKDYLINPLEAREASLEKPESLEMKIEFPDRVDVLDGFIGLDSEELGELHTDLDLAMSHDDLKFIQDYFCSEERDPTITEIRVLDTYWSDHCRHTTFLTEITDIEFEEGDYTLAVKKAYHKYLNTREQVYGDEDRKICLMDIATIGMKEMKKRGLLEDLDESEEINASSIEVEVKRNGEIEKWLVMFKNETHNHPTEIEPFGGAATCLGGAIRDPLSGRSYVYQAMRVTGCADPRTPLSETLEGKLPQRKITTEAADGYSSYGNQIGLATGQVEEFYHPRFVAKHMEIGAVIGAAPRKNVIRNRPQEGDVVILLGGRTGRDGCGGATGSSKKHTEESLFTCGAEVQKGNPPTERKIQRLFRDPEVSCMIKRCNDFGAGGVSVAVGELTESLDINLDAVPKKYEGLDGTELAISESQERMAIVVSPEQEEKFKQAAAEENLEATRVARVTDSGRLRMFWQGDAIVDLSRKFLRTHGAPQQSQVTCISADREQCYLRQIPEQVKENLPDIKKAWNFNLKDLNVCSKQGLREMFDSTIGAGSVLLPYGGKYQETPVDGMVAKVPVLEGDTTTGTIMTFGYNPELAVWSPFHGAVYALVEAVARSVAFGGDYSRVRLTLQEYFEKLRGERERWGKPFSALLGAYLVQTELGIPAVGGKDSMSGTFKDLDVPPTLVAFAVNTADVRNVISPELKRTNHRLVWIRPQKDEHDLPVFSDLKEKYSRIHELIKKDKIRSASAVSMGGAAATITKMAFGNRIGVELEDDLNTKELFRPEHGSIILELADRCGLSELPEYTLLGSTVEEPAIKFRGEEIELEEARTGWRDTLEGIFPTGTESTDEGPDIELYREKNTSVPAVKTEKPQVFIPVFPGTNCEYDTEKKFVEAGAEVETMVFKNLTTFMIEDSLERMVEIIDNSQIIMLPGGFSAGDEPEGSGKFIATVFRSPAVKEAVMRLLNEREGLMLGICNGFQALVKLGLLPYGEIREVDVESPTLTYNTIGRHVSRMVRTRVVSALSPWLAEVEVGDEHVIPVSHGEGRFIAGEDLMEELIASGQIATQYVDPEGNPTYNMPHNPNGSVMAVEGITGPEGRVFGKMGHTERTRANLARNIPGEKEQGIFSAGVNYFK
ncbi:MAG: phosphoribosylformylglycinamidine synthase [Halanaerobiaceae bacterium]